jgi:Vitamin K-dependent gamma-carboxylase
VRQTWNQIRQNCETFFYSRETPFCLAIARIVLPFVIMSMSAPRWFHTRELYSADGAPAQLGLGYGYMNFMPEFSGEVAVALNTLMIVALMCVAVGWRTRISLVISFVLYTYFSLMDAISTMTKYTVITSHLLLILSCSNCGALWSVDAWLARRKGDGLNPLPPSSEAWPRRLMQLMNTPTFLSGDQLQLWMLTHINFRHPLGEYLSMYPVMIKTMAYASIIWEVTFIFLVWKGMWRPVVLAVGVIFHLGTTLLLGLFVFPLTCFTAYLAFMDEHDFLALRRWYRSATADWQIRARVSTMLATVSQWLGSPARYREPAAIAFPSVMILGSLGGVGVEYWMDPYDIRRPEGLHELKPVDPEFAARLLGPTDRIRDKDKFFAIDTGTILVGDLLADRRKVFHHGETMIAQCHLVPPHEDMWIECRMLDADNKLVTRMGQIGMREMFRVNFLQPIQASMDPGDYTLVFETGGREVLRKRIAIVGDNSGVAAH